MGFASRPETLILIINNGTFHIFSRIVVYISLRLVYGLSSIFIGKQQYRKSRNSKLIHSRWFGCIPLTNTLTSTTYLTNNRAS